MGLLNSPWRTHPRPTIIAHMFEFVEDAVQACRAAVVEHHRAVQRDDHRVTDLAALRIRSIMVYLRERDRTEVIHPLTMEWATEGHDPTEHERFRAVVDVLLHSFPDRPTLSASTPQPDPGPAAAR